MRERSREKEKNVGGRILERGKKKQEKESGEPREDPGEERRKRKKEKIRRRSRGRKRGLRSKIKWGEAVMRRVRFFFSLRRKRQRLGKENFRESQDDSLSGLTFRFFFFFYFFLFLFILTFL